MNTLTPTKIHHKSEEVTHTHTQKKKTPWPESVRELYRLSDRRLSAKLVPTFADRGCHVVNVTATSAIVSAF
jgi:hypothetical protein